MKLEKCGGLNVLTELSNDEKLQIKQDLTLANPDYISAKNFGRGRFTNIKPNLFFYSSVGGALIVPRGYNIPFRVDSVVDSTVGVTVKYPKLKIQLRDTQKIAFKEWNKNPEKGVTVLPTGKGKSIYGAYLAYAKRQKTLIVVQKNDLVDGWKKDIITMFPSLRPKKIGLIKSGVFRIGEQYTITTIQTLSKLSSKELAELYSTFGMIIVDEFHHSPASSYGILKYFRSKYFVGLTATDMREDGLQKVLYWMFGDVCYRHPESDSDEDIMPFSVVFRKSNIVYQPETEYDKRGRVIPLNINELRKVISSSSKFNDLVANDIINEYNLKKSCIVFIHEKDHIRYLADLLIRKGVNKDKIQLYYGDAKESDSVMKERAESKEVLITLATYSKATEGTNVKAWERCFLVSSLNNEKGVIQAVGRARRRKQGKVDVIVYDYSHPSIKSVCKHIDTRMRAYKSLKANFSNSTPNTKNMGLITKGWNYKK